MYTNPQCMSMKLASNNVFWQSKVHLHSPHRLYVLKHLKEVLIRRLTAQQDHPINPADIQWALTVPAIWTHKEKQLMREAACLVCEC